MGASNLARLPPIWDNNVQVDCFPGCNLAQATFILKIKDTKFVVMHLGLNDRSRMDTSRTSEDLKELLRTAKDTFPFAKIRIP